jgi:RimK-like ATP-grasp domain
MPSKGGRREDLVVVPPTPSQPIDVSVVGLDAMELARPLRRGHEVERFTDLARRQTELQPAESDELYRYRLRRLARRERHLERAIDTGGEEQVRDALSDYRSRLGEVRALEELRSRAGLPAGYQANPDLEVDGTGRLVQMATLRPGGLIAGEGPSATGAGEDPVELPEAPFTPGADDAPLYLLAPSSLPSAALARSVSAVAAEGAEVHLVHDASTIPRDRPALVLNWGGVRDAPSDLVVLNRPESVEVASDQVATLRQLGDLAPRTVVNPNDVHLLGSDRVVAKRRRGTRGSNKRVVAANSPPTDLAGYDLYQEFVAEPREYRVSVLSGRVVSAYLRRRPEGAPSDELHAAWTFERVRQVPAAVAETARRAAERVGLDYAGMDVIEDLRTGRVMCLEANAAPGMSEDTVRSLYATVQQVVRGTEG